MAIHNLIIGNIHPRVSIYLRKEAYRLSSDEVSEVAEKDLLIVLDGNSTFVDIQMVILNRQIRADKIVTRAKEKKVKT